MNVVVPYTRIVGALPIAARLLRVPDCDDGYWQILRDVWNEGETFIVVEHDVSPSIEALTDLWECPGLWCIQPYWHPAVGLVRTALGCAKFGASAMVKVPDLFEIIRDLPFHPGDPELVPTHWKSLNVFMVGVLYSRGLKHHEHNIRVDHRGQ